jgi:hypothetical protein
MALYQTGTGLSAFVGIGTTNPTSNLQVSGNVSCANAIIAYGFPASIVQGSNVFVFSNAIGGSNVLIMNSNAQVGIGTVNPAGLFHAAGSGWQSYIFESYGMTSFTGGPSIILRALGSAPGWQSQCTLQTVYSATSPGGTTNFTTATYPSGGYNNFNLYSSNVYIDGNVGIGTAASAAKLIVNGLIQGTGLYSTSTIYTNYTQGTNQPNNGQAHFFNPTAAANQDASCAVRINSGAARYAYFSMDVAGLGGYSMGILGSSQNLVFRASWDMSSNTLFTMDRSGNFTATASVSANSDRRIKTDLQVIPNALEKVKKISGYTFMRTDADLPRQAGVIAQELLEVLPEVVHKNDDGIYSVSYGNIVALLIEALKEESAKREELEKRLNYSSIVVNCTESVIHI